MCVIENHVCQQPPYYSTNQDIKNQLSGMQFCLSGSYLRYYGEQPGNNNNEEYDLLCYHSEGHLKAITSCSIANRMCLHSVADSTISRLSCFGWCFNGSEEVFILQQKHHKNVTKKKKRWLLFSFLNMLHLLRLHADLLKASSKTPPTFTVNLLPLFSDTLNICSACYSQI